MKKIRIAQIGTSKYSHGRMIFDALKASESFEIAGYAFPEKEDEKYEGRLLESFKGYPRLTVEQILSDPTIEAVTVETEEIYLTKYALLAAEHGKHIHMEKPGGAELPAFEKLIDTVKRSGKVFQIGYMYRYNPMISALIERVKNGELGDIISVEAQMNCFYNDEQREWLGNLPGGIMFFLGCHLLDLIVQLQGFPKKVIPLNKSTGVHGVHTTDFGMAALEYDNGVSFAKVNTLEKGGYLRRQLVVCGTNRTVEVKPLEVDIGDSTVYTCKHECEKEDWLDTGKSEQTASFNRYGEMMECFAKKCRGEMPLCFTPDYELVLYRLLLQACGEEA